MRESTISTTVSPTKAECESCAADSGKRVSLCDLRAYSTLVFDSSNACWVMGSTHSESTAAEQRGVHMDETLPGRDRGMRSAG